MLVVFPIPPIFWTLTRIWIYPVSTRAKNIFWYFYLCMLATKWIVLILLWCTFICLFVCYFSKIYISATTILVLGSWYQTWFRFYSLTLRRALFFPFRWTVICRITWTFWNVTVAFVSDVMVRFYISDYRVRWIFYWIPGHIFISVFGDGYFSYR